MDIYLVDVDSGERRLMTAHDGEAVNAPGPWLPDGTGFYLVSDTGREFKGLALCRVETGTTEWIATPDWDVEAVDLSRDGSMLLYSVNENGLSRLYVRRVGGEDEAIEGLGAGALEDMALTPDGKHAIIQLNSATRGTDLFRVDLDDGKVEQITFGLLGGVPADAFVEPQVVTYTSFDGRRIPALLFKPDIAEGGKIPVVLSIHGGPESQERPEYRYNGLYQYLAYRGVAVLAPNIRGSTGYGKSYQRLIYHDWGGDDLKDMEHAAQYLLEQDWVDPDRIGVFGGSYGGFATLSCVTRLPQYWAAGAELVGPSNLVTFATAVPPTWKQFIAELLGDPETEASFLLERSPITYVDQIRCPLLVIQGANDYRVVKAESDQMVERIRARGGMVDYIVLTDEGHIFTRRTNQIEAFRAVAEFFLDRFGLSNLLREEMAPAGAAGA
jgi:dipeptidyl aminopeptidase/acylaminoacyl peptidase